MSAHSPHLVLFFTHGVSLRTWDETGTFEREVALYRRLQARGYKITFITYGDASDRDYAPRIPGITIRCNRWGLPLDRYRRLLPLLHAPALIRADVFKTNQSYGADAALRAARLWRKPLIARAGFMWALFLANVPPDVAAPYDQDALIGTERDVFQRAQHVVVTTERMRDHTVNVFGVPAGRVTIIPNYMLTDVFAPTRTSYSGYRKILYVGRLQAEKNLPGLFEAARGLDVELTLIGRGVQADELKALAESYALTVNFVENVPNEQLPGWMNEADLFVLLSFSEGHPKSLLEAMSCGTPVLGADSPGIRDLIRHRETGYLCGTEPEAIRAALLDVLGDVALRERMGRGARQYVLDHLALDKIAEQETGVIDSVLAAWKDRK
ncbi:glycosyltransferase family 4 protein [Aggregatilinea lenta]|uniref:glycosyltransferase family 4 protein n=1 Tax=Aggregatilinea lenta TaxID=913108 RepID=UPI000E5BC146|nr:glycosyltransferase family 4 protein [Aggregatilinea lenta]